MRVSESDSLGVELNSCHLGKVQRVVQGKPLFGGKKVPKDLTLVLFLTLSASWMYFYSLGRWIIVLEPFSADTNLTAT